MEKRLLYEHLGLDAFRCKRADYYFANADYYDGVANHPDETCAFILCALLNCKNTGTIGAELFAQLYNKTFSIHALEDAFKKQKGLDEILSILNEKGII